MGRLYVVGFGCGSRGGITQEAAGALRSSDAIVGYTAYTDIIRELFPEKEYISTGMRGEIKRVDTALDEALSGRTVSIISSGDPAVYGMAGLVFERFEKILADREIPVSPDKAAYANAEDLEIVVIPGVTAALSSAALLGAPLGNDFAVISLSDLLTPWDRIERRLKAAASADLNIVLYNPSSKGRPDHLRRACGILLEFLSPDTVCGYARNTGRRGQETGIMKLSELEGFSADMFTTVFVGNSETRVICGRMVTPRGYSNG